MVCLNGSRTHVGCTADQDSRSPVLSHPNLHRPLTADPGAQRLFDPEDERSRVRATEGKRFSPRWAAWMESRPDWLT